MANINSIFIAPCHPYMSHSLYSSHMSHTLYTDVHPYSTHTPREAPPLCTKSYRRENITKTPAVFRDHLVTSIGGMHTLFFKKYLCISFEITTKK